MSKLEELQPLLPAGLVLVEQLAVPEQQGLAFKASDRRGGGNNSILRLVRVIVIEEPEGWRDKWLTQLHKLSHRATGCLCRPLELGAAGPDCIYLVFDWFPKTLADLIPQAGVSSRAVAWSVLDQVAAALDELHRYHGAHGDLRAEHVFVDTTSLTEESRAWLGGVELGHLPHWSSAARMDPKSRDLFPPEWQGNLREPTKPADVFALGLLAVELFAGRSARAAVTAAPTGSAANTTGRAAQHLKTRVGWWQPQPFLLPLLDGEKDRFANGTAVVNRWNWRKPCEIAALPVGITALLIAIAFLGIWWREGRLRSERDAERNRAAAAELRLVDATDSAGRLSNELAEARTAQAEAMTQLTSQRRDTDPPVPGIPDVDLARKLWSQEFSKAPVNTHATKLKSLAPQPSARVGNHLREWTGTVQQAWDGINHSWTAEQRRRESAYSELLREPWNESLRTKLVQAFWRDFFASPTDPMEKLAAVEAAFETTCQKVSQEHWLRIELAALIKSLENRKAGWQRWNTQPPKLTQPWRKRLEVPWDATVRASEEEMLAALVAAEAKWKEVDGRGDLTWPQFQEQFKTAVTATGKPRAEEVAYVWIDQFNSMTANSTATFRLKSGAGPANSGTTRTIDVHVDGSLSALDDDVTVHTWASATDHVYPSTTPPIAFPWHPGQSLQVKVYGERQSLKGGLRSECINQKFLGPVAFWRLGQMGTIVNGVHSLTIEIGNCPGPPVPTTEERRAMIR